MPAAVQLTVLILSYVKESSTAYSSYPTLHFLQMGPLDSTLASPAGFVKCKRLVYRDITAFKLWA